MVSGHLSGFCDVARSASVVVGTQPLLCAVSNLVVDHPQDIVVVKLGRLNHLDCFSGDHTYNSHLTYPFYHQRPIVDLIAEDLLRGVIAHKQP